MVATTDRIVKLLKSGKVEEAETALREAPADALGSNERKLYTAMILEREGKWAQAAQTYQQILKEEPDCLQAAFRLAYLADLRGDDETAIELYETVTEGSPAHVNALLNLAVLYEDHSRYEESLACLQRVLDEYPNHERARLFRRDVVASLDMYYDEERERSREERSAILERPISDFELSVRSRNCLKQMNIHTLGDLLKATAAELLSYKNFGETSLHEIETMLAQEGLRIGQLLEESEQELSSFSLPPGMDPAQAGILNRSVAELELSVRARKCLMRLGINTIAELTQRTESELLSIKNFGMTSLAEIKRRLAELGLGFKNI
ncbi:MAG: DNA-directed RNA polymerase subunit alpha C-terminal domain-containing protein [Phycisphaerae bacterium]